MTAAAALDVLARATRHAEQQFWPLGREISAGLLPVVSRPIGHGQWTDAVLLRHAPERDGVLVISDPGVKKLAAAEWNDHLLVLKHD